MSGVRPRQARHEVNILGTRHDFVDLTKPANIGITAMEIDGVRYMVNVWVAPADFLKAKIALHETILNNLLAQGVKLPGIPL